MSEKLQEVRKKGTSQRAATARVAGDSKAVPVLSTLAGPPSEYAFFMTQTDLKVYYIADLNFSRMRFQYFVCI